MGAWIDGLLAAPAKQAREINGNFVAEHLPFKTTPRRLRVFVRVVVADGAQQLLAHRVSGHPLRLGNVRAGVRFGVR